MRSRRVDRCSPCSRQAWSPRARWRLSLRDEPSGRQNRPKPPTDQQASHQDCEGRGRKPLRTPVHEKEATAYWQSIADKRRARIAKRRNGEPIVLDDYVLTQPPVYTGPPRPPGYVPPQPRSRAAAGCRSRRSPISSRPRPSNTTSCRDRPKTELEFKQAYAKVAAAAGLTRDQAVRIYAFETGGNGTYDGQAGIDATRQGRARRSRRRSATTSCSSTNTVEPAGRARRQVRRRAEGVRRRRSARADAQGDGQQDRGAEEDDRVQPHACRTPGASTTSSPRPRRAAWASTPRCSTATSARCCRPRSCSIRCMFAQSEGPHAAADRGRARDDELHRRRQRLRHGDHAAGIARARCRPRTSSSAAATSAIRSRGAPARSRRCSRRSRPRWTAPGRLPGADRAAQAPSQRRRAARSPRPPAPSPPRRSAALSIVIAGPARKRRDPAIHEPAQRIQFVRANFAAAAHGRAGQARA